jgi:sialidase-1
MYNTTKHLTRFLLAALLAVGYPSWGQTTLFTTVKGTGQDVYRIPSIVRLPNGNLWAFCDLRYDNNGSDLGSNHRIDVVGKLSSDNGTSWGDRTDIAKGNSSSSGYDFAHGDPASVVDRESGSIMVLAASGKNGWSSSGAPLVARSVSTDGGSTWTKSEISNQLYVNGFNPGSIFFSSGRMIQSTLVKKGAYYRIYAAVDTYNNGSCVVYSDDFGATWSYLGGTSARPASSGDECKVEELPNGNILLSCRVRSSTGRLFNIFTFTDKENAIGSWGTAVSGNITAASCNGEVLLVPATRASDSKQVYVLLQSAAMSNNREKVGIYWKVLESESDYDAPSDFSSGWSSYSVTNNYSCYSTMVLDKNGDVAFLYEDEIIYVNSGSGYNIKFKTIPLSTITSNQYKYSANTTGYRTTSELATTKTSDGEDVKVTVAAPTFSITTGTYNTPQSVTLTSATDGATIYYTTDGSTPSAQNGTKYTEAITVSATTTINAIAVDGDGNVSDVTSATYTIDITAPSMPTFSVAAGTYSVEQTVELTADDGTTIYYTTDGTEPTTESTPYTEAITVTTTTTIKAIAVDGDGNKSAVATASYSIVAADNTTKLGTTISLDNGSSHSLFASNSGGGGYFGFLRHDIAHVQIITSNDSTLSGNDDGLLANIDNDMIFTTVDETTYLSVNTSDSYPSVYVQVVAPKGYRFARYQMEFLTDQCTSGSAVKQYTYDADGNVVTGDAMFTSDGSCDRTLADGTNVLYFRFDMGTSQKIVLKSFHVTYVIDQPVTGQIPNTDGTLNLHTGLLDLGTFSKNSSSVWSFSRTGVTDLQAVSLVNGEGTAQTQTYETTDGQYFVLTANGDYYLEAPQKFRIVGATLKFLRHSATGTTTGTTYTYADASSVSSGSSYIITDGSGNYLNLSNGSLVNGTNGAEATLWTVTSSSSSDRGPGRGNTTYTITSGGYSLVLSNNSLSTSTSSSTSWYYSSNNNNKYFYYSSSENPGPGPNQNQNRSYIGYSNGGWTVSSSTSTSKLQTRTASTGTTTTTLPASDFTATVNNRENTAAATDGTLQLTETNPSATLTVDDYNNDAIHFNISGLAAGSSALYNVYLQLMPLNPEVQTLQVAAKNGTTVVGSNEVTSTNYTFHNGEAVKVLVPTTLASPYTIVFRNAENEEKTLWYTEGVNNNNLASTGGYSNYCLVGSSAFNATDGLSTSATPYPGARVNSDVAGTNELSATNIVDVAKGTTTELKDLDYAAGAGGLQTVSLAANTEQEVYIYSADMPTWNIMPTGIGSGKRHVDYRFYTITVKPVVAEETAVVTVTPIYTKTQKGTPNKTSSSLSSDNSLDETHTYVGVTVTSLSPTNDDTADGVLTNTKIIDAIKEAMKAGNYYGFSESDPLRSILYVDMSGLTAVSAETTDGANNWDAFNDGTADNCLYFMPVGFTRNVANTVAKTAAGGYEAVGDIVLQDQQPFFTPYSFTTGTRKASYTRTGTNGKALVQNMTAVLPFSVALDGNGNLKTSDDVTDNSVTFHNITGYGKVTAVSATSGKDVTYAMVATAVADSKAEANKPYYVTSTTPGFAFNITGAQFVKTPEGTTTSDDTGVTESLERTSNNWTAYGTYAGVTPDAKDDNGVGVWYFAKELFWNSAQLTEYKTVNVRPFRSYYKTTDTSASVQNAAKAAVVFDENDVTTTGISDVSAAEGDLTVSTGHGTMTLTAASATRYATYTVGGQLVARGMLGAGETRSLAVPAGVYVVNNQKVVVR